MREGFVELFKINMPYLLVVIAIALSHFVFRGNEIATLLSFIVLIPIFAYFKFDNRIPIGYAILMLVLAAITLAINNKEELANQLAIYAYYLLVVGVIGMLIEEMR